MTDKTRAILFAAAIATLLAALPALAAGAPAQTMPLPAFLTAPPASGCAGSADLQASLAVPGTPSLAPAPTATNGLEGLLSQSTTKFRGYLPLQLQLRQELQHQRRLRRRGLHRRDHLLLACGFDPPGLPAARRQPVAPHRPFP